MKTIILSDIGFAQILSSASFPINKKLSQKEPPPKKNYPIKKPHEDVHAVCCLYHLSGAPNASRKK